MSLVVVDLLQERTYLSRKEAYCLFGGLASLVQESAVPLVVPVMHGLSGRVMLYGIAA